MKTGFFTDPIFLEHDTGDHPENSGRLEAISSAVQSSGLRERLQITPGDAASLRMIEHVHDADYIRQVQEAANQGRGYFGTPDCIVSPQTYQVALHAAGSVVQAAVEVAESRLDNAFVACRPPGHHAENSQAMGFCYFNNVAIAAEALIRDMGFERVLIFDFDVHHGNGTQHTFESRKDVFYCSIHQDPRTCYPGTGFAEEKGRGEGAGYTLNVPVLPQAADRDYQDAFERIMLPAFREFDPQIVLLSAGFDAHRDDPLAQVDLTQEGFDNIGRGMKQLAAECCGGKIVSVLEGGYNYTRLSECVSSHLEILLSDSS